MAWTRHPNAYQEPPLRANRRTLHGKAAGQGIIVTPISLKSAVLPPCPPEGGYPQ